MSGMEIKAAVGSKTAQRCGCASACLYNAASTSKMLLDRYFQFLTTFPSCFPPYIILEEKTEFNGTATAEGSKMHFWLGES